MKTEDNERIAAEWLTSCRIRTYARTCVTTMGLRQQRPVFTGIISALLVQLSSIYTLPAHFLPLLLLHGYHVFLQPGKFALRMFTISLPWFLTDKDKVKKTAMTAVSAFFVSHGQRQSLRKRHPIFWRPCGRDFFRNEEFPPPPLSAMRIQDRDSGNPYPSSENGLKLGSKLHTTETYFRVRGDLLSAMSTARDFGAFPKFT